MRNRCNNPKNKSFFKYGGRGITVCERWELFTNFLADMGPRPSLRHSIERKDNNGPYSPENCEWAVPKTQARNRRTSRLIEFEGVTKTLAEWSESTGLSAGTIIRRIDVSGWTIKEALTIQVIAYRRGGLTGVI